jgi:hypothetical protein
MPDSGHEAVGQALLVTGVAIGALSAAELGRFVMDGLTRLMTALG